MGKNALTGLNLKHVPGRVLVWIYVMFWNFPSESKNAKPVIEESITSVPFLLLSQKMVNH